MLCPKHNATERHTSVLFPRAVPKDTSPPNVPAELKSKLASPWTVVSHPTVKTAPDEDNRLANIPFNIER